MASPIPARIARSARRDGMLRTGLSCARWGGGYLAGLPRAGRDPGATFSYEGAELPYLRHRYNWTWLNERAVEVPLALRTLAARSDERVLEVGNVLAHYGAHGHEVVDRYERAAGVVNEDAATFDAGGRRFDLILSVSTLEHVGYDEQPRERDKAARAVRRLADLLAPGGLLWMTVPVGYNDALEDAIRGDRLGLTRVGALRRFGRRLDWREVPPEETRDAAYDRLLYVASAILVCELSRPVAA